MIMYLYFHAFIVCINSNNFVSGFMAVKTINLMPTGYCSVAKHLEFLISYMRGFLTYFRPVSTKYLNDLNDQFNKVMDDSVDNLFLGNK